MKRIEWTEALLQSLPTTRDVALDIGSKSYFPNKVCEKGHLSAYIANSGHCFLCAREKVRQAAERRRRREGRPELKKVGALPVGARHGQLTATGAFEQRPSRRVKGKVYNYPMHQVMCDCGTKFFLVNASWGVTKSCRTCASAETALKNITHGMSGSLPAMLLEAAKKRAKKYRRPFALTLEDIRLPKFCPILGIELAQEIRGQSGTRAARANAPSIDRVDSNQGYTPENCSIISWRANVLKKDGTAEEHRAVAAFMRRQGVSE